MAPPRPYPVFESRELEDGRLIKVHVHPLGESASHAVLAPGAPAMAAQAVTGVM